MQAADLQLITAAAEDAGRIALQFWRGKFRHWDKDAGAGPVSDADMAVNDRLEALLRAARPDYGWLSEESVDDAARTAAGRVFIVDPIDGTRAFIDGQDGFAVCVAVVQDGRPIAGVVHLPARQTTYAAVAGGTATRDGRPIRPSAADIDGARVLTAKAALDPVHWQGGRVPRLERAFRSSLAWRLCLVAEGRFDAVLSVRPAWDWDIAAATVIAEAAGCTATDLSGRPFRFNRLPPQNAGLVVANPGLHAQISNALRKAPA